MNTAIGAAADESAVYILHDNPEWIAPFAAALGAVRVPFREWLLEDGVIDLDAVPPAGVFWSRLSASSHTRGRVHAKDHARAVLRWLEAHGRRVVNGSHVTELEVSKVAQHSALRAAGIETPRTIAVFGQAALAARAHDLPAPFITKHNQGGKGLGVRRFDSAADFVSYVEGDEFEDSADGITLLQEHITTADASITRAEFVDGVFVYAVRVDTSAGSFELCPAEACVVPEGSFSQGIAPAACDVPAAGVLPAFVRRTDIDARHPLIIRLEGFLRAHRIDIAGIEFFETPDGRLSVYDINTNTNYNPDVEATTGHSAAAAVAEFLGAELAASRRSSLQPA